ncbi:metal-dependent transcriptional regulator [Candidatus Pacearchaeota archaeon]|nr:metal-dependent transcriptional regulator [Candidatus Pacearchaeota archaeon]
MKGKEDYLKVIYELKKARSIDISRELGISKPSVSEMLRKLAKLKLVKFKPYSKVSLTARGRREAGKIIKKHEIIEKFAGKIGHKNPHQEAHILEHYFSDNMIKHLDNFLSEKKPETLPSYIN